MAFEIFITCFFILIFYWMVLLIISQLETRYLSPSSFYKILKMKNGSITIKKDVILTLDNHNKHSEREYTALLILNDEVLEEKNVSWLTRNNIYFRRPWNKDIKKIFRKLYKTEIKPLQISQRRHKKMQKKDLIKTYRSL